MADLIFSSKKSINCVGTSTTQSSRGYGLQSLPVTPPRSPIPSSPVSISPTSIIHFPFQEPPLLGKVITCDHTFGAPPTATALAFDPLMNCSKNDRDKATTNFPNRLTTSKYIYPRITDDVEVSACLTDDVSLLSISLPQQDEESRMEDHMATLGVKPKDSKKRYRYPRRLPSIEKKILIAKSKSFKNLGKNKNRRPTHSRTSTAPDLGNETKDLLDMSSFFDDMPKLDNGSVTVSGRSIMHRRGKSQPGNGTSFLAHCTSTRLRSSELEPSCHQIELPTSGEVLTQARICALLEDYRLIDQNFDFSNLIGMSRLGMEGFIQTGATPLAEDYNLVDRHIPVVKNLMECMDSGDLVVEGFFHTGNVDGAVDDRVEVAILRSESQRQIMAVWRGTSTSQEKPVSKKELKAVQAAGAKGLQTLHPDHLTPILPSFRQAYFGDELESKVFDSLNRLSEEFPFFDLVCTGFSFGAALAAISASRYATSFPMMRVSCFAFESPKIGGTEWRQHVHSLPNLKVFRMQQGADAWATTDSTPAESVLLTHVGHSIIISLAHSSGSSASCSSGGGGGGLSFSPPASPRSRARKNGDSVKALAYKFDQGLHPLQPSSKSSRVFKLKKPSLKNEKRSHTIHAYVHSMKHFTHLGSPWVTEYSGEDVVGTGVKGLKKAKKRNVV